MKRLLDIAVSALGLVVALPVILVLIVLIRRDSEGPGIFSQERIGREGKPFRCHKLRTMTVDTPNVPSHHATAAHVTRIGGFLRRSKLDELPQLWNVLRGDMSLVGPRPCLPSQTELIEERRKRGVLSVRPGVTGLSQVNGIDMSDPVRLAQSDEVYVRSRSFVGDLKLIAATFVRQDSFGDRIKDGRAR